MNTHKLQNGLTLLELSIVLLILTALAGMAVPYMNASQDIAREQITSDRALAIKNAIIKTDTINGLLTTSGFVIDVGRLPNTISELTNGKDCSTAIAPDFICTNLIQNWKGPYLNSITGDYFDGWGTQPNQENQNNTENPNNFGWGFTLNNDKTSIDIKSLSPQSSTQVTIYQSDWSINMTTSSITINLIPPSGYCQSNSSNTNTTILPIANQATCKLLPGTWSLSGCSIQGITVQEISKEEQCTNSATWKPFNPSAENPLTSLLVINGNILTTTDNITSNQIQSIDFSLPIAENQSTKLLPAGQHDIEVFITDEKLKLNPEIINTDLSVEKIDNNKLIFIPFQSKKYLSIPRYTQNFNWN